MDKKRSSLGLNLSSKKSKTAEKEKIYSGFNSPVSNKSTSLYKSVLKESVGKPARNLSKVRFSLSGSTEKSPREGRQSKEFDFHCSFESEEENSPDNSFSCTQPVRQEAVLQGVVAYIEVRSNTENRFQGVSKQMELLGAVVLKKFIPEVTHVIFKDGKKRTRERAIKRGIHLVNVLWVESCRQSGKRAPEELFPVVVPDEVHTPIGKLKRTKSMQPRPFEDDVRKSAERVNRKRQRKDASEKTPTSLLSPLTRRLLCEDTHAPSSPAIVGSCTPTYSVPSSPGDQDREEAVPEDVPNKRLDFDESSTKQKKNEKDSTNSKRSRELESSETPCGPSLLAPVKTPVDSPRTIPTDILQTASGPGKKRKRIKSTKESTSNEPDEKPKQNKKNKPTNSPQKQTDVFTFDEEEIPEVKTRILKKKRVQRSKSTSSVESKSVEVPMSTALHPDEQEDDLRANANPKKNKVKEIQSSKQQTTQPPNNMPSSPSEKIAGPRDTERDVDDMVSDSVVSVSEVETQIKSTKVLPKKNSRMRKYKKTEKLVSETLSAEDENELEVDVEEKIKINSRKQTECKNNQAKRVKRSVLKRNNESVKKETANNLRYDEDEKQPDSVFTATESDEEKNDQSTSKNERNVKKTKRNKENKGSKNKKIVSKKIPDEDDVEGDDDDDIGDDTGDDDHVNEEEDDVSDNDDCGGDRVLCKPKEKQNIGKQKLKEKSVERKKPSRSLVLTSMHFSEQDIVISVVRKLGGFYIADSVGPNTTHVISGSARRTLNVLMAIAQGNWLVSPEWVMKSLETGYWIDEEPYELADAFPSAQLSRLERVSSGPEYCHELFVDVEPIFVSDKTSPPRDALVLLITLCGGKVCTSIRKAGVCVGNISRKSKAIHVAERWVIDSITEHNALPLSSYILNPTKSTSPTF